MRRSSPAVSTAPSWIGDHFTKVAVSYVVFAETRSVVLSGQSAAVVPWAAPMLATQVD
jgi:hypothetical protein